jgi:hypothetical protein
MEWKPLRIKLRFVTCKQQVACYIVIKKEMSMLKGENLNGYAVIHNNLMELILERT